MPASTAEVRAQMTERLRAGCQLAAELGLCVFIGDTTDDISREVVHGDISPEQAEAKVRQVDERIGKYCTGKLIDQGCWHEPLCPADPRSDFKLHRSRRSMA